MLFARLAQSVEREALNLVVVGSSPTLSKGNREFSLRQKRTHSWCGADSGVMRI